MSLDPRTPVLVGGGQINHRQGGEEPVDLIVAAARLAAQESGSGRILAAVDSVRIVGMLSWRYRDPGALVARRIGAGTGHTGYTGNGGNTPQALVNGAAADIAAGRAEVVLIGGAEAWRTRMRLKAAGERPGWTVQDDTTVPPENLGADVPMVFEGQRRVGLDRPSSVYPLFEQALRIAAGRSLAEHRAHLGQLWSQFSQVAAGNPHAWSRRAYTGEEIITASEQNRWISSPYTKLMNSNNMVEQGAALLLCSAEAAEQLGVPRDRWIFPQAGTEAHDSYDITERADLHRSPAIRAAGRRALELAGREISEIDLVDLYSCFPSAVQVAAGELGLPLADPARPLTVTGGLTFAGGPWNNYSTHAIATMATLLRRDGGVGLLTANGGYLTKHAVGIYATEPPAAGFRSENVQAEADRTGTTPALTEYAGRAGTETWTVVHDRAGTPERGFLMARTDAGARTLAATTEFAALQRMAGEDLAGAAVRIGGDGRFVFAD